jgi:hypothetical protein
MVLENNENHLADEIGKVKDRLKTITSSLENQQTFLRLIIQVCNATALIMFAKLHFFNAIILFFRKWKLRPKKMKWMKACQLKKWHSRII